MSHFFVAVLVEPDAAEPEQRAGELLEPFNENGTWFREGSRWDWWMVGGRYEGRVPNNIAPVHDLPESFKCWAILTPDGEWHEKAEMGWFGMTRTDEDDEWEGKMRRILAEHNACTVVGVDCHV